MSTDQVDQVMVIADGDLRSAPRHWQAYRGRRRMVAGSVFALAVFDVVLAAARHPVLHIEALSIPLSRTGVDTARYALLMCALALLLSTAGILRGTVSAARVSVLAAAGSAVAAHLKREDFAGVVFALVVIALVVIEHPAFTARSDPARFRTGLRWLVAGQAAALGYGVGGLYLLDTNFRTSMTLGHSLDQAIRLIVLLPASTVAPSNRHGAWFIDSVRVLAAVVIVVSLARLFSPVVLAPRRRAGAAFELRRVRAILDRHGDGPLAHFHLLGDKEFVFAADGDAFVGYRLAGRVAVALGGPVGDARGRRAATTAFLDRCTRNGWQPCFYQATCTEVAELERFGLRATKIGEEAILDLPAFSLAGQPRKSLRQAVNRAGRACAVEVLPSPLSDHHWAELSAVSAAWLVDGHRERGFSLGRLDRGQLDRTTVLAARDPAGVVVAFVNELPRYTGEVATFDLMRRTPDAPNGVMDLLIASMIDRAKEDGAKGFTLGTAPFTGLDGDTVTERTLRAVAARGEWLFRYAGLRAYKEKWGPQWEARFIAHPGETTLPRAALAVLRVGELEGSALWRRG